MNDPKHCERWHDIYGCRDKYPKDCPTRKACLAEPFCTKYNRLCRECFGCCDSMLRTRRREHECVYVLKFRGSPELELGRSIEKWKKIAHGTGVDLGMKNCSLCQEFAAGSCKGCPIDEDSKKGCKGTPYDDWCSHHRNEHGQPQQPYKVENGCAKCRELALDKLNYLKSLLTREKEED